MKLWISRDVPTSIAAQLSAQLLLGILSGALPAGHKLPSVRELARRLKIHANTVSGVYRDLAGRDWVVSKRGSGVFVKAQANVDAFVREWLAAAQTMGHSMTALREAFDRVSAAALDPLVVDTDAELARILAAELSEAVGVPVRSAGIPAAAPTNAALWVSAAQAGRLAAALPGVAFRTLRLRSMPEILEGARRPEGPTMIAVVSYSASVRTWAETLLAALGFAPDSLMLVDPAVPGWRRGLCLCGVVSADVVAGREVEGKVFRLLSEESIAEVRVTLQKLS